MKARSRILAMLLTLLMIVGILPLSLFALDEPLPEGNDGQAAIVDRAQQEIQDEFDKVGMNFAKYQTFEKLTPEILTNLRNSSNQIYLGAGPDWSNSGKTNVDNSEYSDVDDLNSYFCIADQKPAYSIVTEADGNKALYLGNAPQAEYSNNENFIAYQSVYAGNNEDLYISIDLKMAGDKISAATQSLFNFVTRPSGAKYTYTVNLSTSGELYIGEYNEKNILAKLSKDVYTRVAIATDRINNKYYVYVNDELVNVGGTTLFSTERVEEFNNEAYTASNLPLDAVRIYVAKDNIEGNGKHEGIYFDNLTVGNRLIVKEGLNTADNVFIQSNFANAVHGMPVAPNPDTATEGWRDAYPDAKSGWPVDVNAFGTLSGSSVNGCLWQDSVIYVDEDVTEEDPDGDGIVDAIKWTYDDKVDGTESDQAYLGLGTPSLAGGFRLSMELKMGEGGVSGHGNFVFLRGNNISGDLTILSLDSDGTLRVSGKQIGNLSKTDYTKVEIDMIPAQHGGTYFVVRVDGAPAAGMFYNKAIGPNYFRVYPKYDGGIAELKVDDLHLKSIKVETVSDYNELAGLKGTPFAKNPKGFIEKNGILRYYDGNGGYATKDFFIGTTKYMVGNDGEIISKVSGALANRSFDDIKAEFAKQGVNVSLYQSFTGWPVNEDGIANFNSEKSTPEYLLYKDSDANNNTPPTTSSIKPYTDKQSVLVNAEAGDASNLGHGGLKNWRDSYRIVTEADGNKALYFDWAPATVVPSADNKNNETGAGYASGDTKDEIADSLANNDNFIDLGHNLPDSYKNQTGDGSHDYFISIDLKMNDVNIQNCALFALIYRPEAYIGASYNNIVSLTDNGGIYISEDFGPHNLVGYLSQDEYTRIALSTDRVNNKFYLYINDVLVTPDGATLWSDTVIARMNEKNTRNNVVYNGSNLPLAEVRILNTSSSGSTDSHKGLFIDNLLYGTRLALRDVTTTVATSAAMSFEGADKTGVTLEAYGAGGKFDPGKFYSGANPAIGANSDGTDANIRYVDETGDGIPDAIEYHKVADNGDGQAFFNAPNNQAKGTNLRFSIDLKAGQSEEMVGTSGDGDQTFLMFRTASGQGGVNSHKYEIYVNLGKDGTLYANSKTGNVLGKLSKIDYTNLTIDFICSTSGSPVALFYFGGELVHEQFMRLEHTNTNYQYYDYHPSFVRIYSLYVGATDSLSDQDVRIRALSYGSTNEYDVAPDRISVFQNDIAGLHGVGGIMRYYNGDGTYQVKDFEVGGEKYLVGYAGVVIGKESDGREFAPYAPYVDWEHTGSLHVNSPTGYYITGKGDGGNKDTTTIVQARDGYWKQGTVDGNEVTLYTSYYDWEPGSTATANNPNGDHSSYVCVNFPNGAKNTAYTIDFDIMLGTSYNARQIAPGSHQPFFYLRGDANSDNSAGNSGRRDYDFPYYMTGDGWLVRNDGNKYTKLFKLSEREFTRFSFVVHGPVIASDDSIEKQSYVDIYVNGVLVESVQNAAAAKYLQQIRFLKICNSEFNAYIKNFYAYESAKPQQFVGMVDGVPTLTMDQSVDPARPANFKQGFVEENGVARFYNDIGLPVFGIFTEGGKVYEADKFGKVPCDGVNHLKVTEKGYCIGCGKTMDGVSSLFATSLVLGTNVKVVFYLDIDADNAKAVEIGLARDYTNTAIKTALADLKKVTFGEKEVYEVVYEVTAKDICSDITVKVVKNDDTTGTEFNYSAADYAEGVQKVPTDATYTAELKALAKALLVYGKNAAAVLLPDAEAAEEITEAVDWSGVTILDGFKDLYQAIILDTVTLELKSNIKLKVYFTLNSGNFGMKTLANYTFKVDGEEVEYTDLGDGKYCIEKEIVAANLDEVYTFEIVDPIDGTGLCVKMSALYYAKIMAANANAPEGYANLMKAIKLYSDAANAYTPVTPENTRPAV